MNVYLLFLLIFGIAALGMAWMPAFTEKTRLSFSIVYVLAGVIIFSVFDSLPRPDPFLYEDFTLRLTELVLIVSLMGTGLKIDQPFTFKIWRLPLRLVTISMLMSIVIVSVMGYGWLELSIPSALLLGAALAPTDPVLASDVQVGPPNEEHKDNVRFTLTAEAGLNDGMAFPFTWLAILVLTSGVADFNWGHWFVYHLVYKILAGVACGYLLGKGIAHVLFSGNDNDRKFTPRDGFISLCVTFITYAFTEMIHGYGFIAVFVAAISIRNYELDHRYHKTLHAFADQIERIMLAILLILFGGGLVAGNLINEINVPIVVFALICVMVVRPAVGWIVQRKSTMHIKEKAAISFFGIKGIGSFFYLAFAFSYYKFEDESLLWTIVSTVVLASILIHGTSATRIFNSLKNQFNFRNK